MKAPIKTPLTIRIDPEIADGLRVVARRNRRTISGEMELALEAHLLSEEVRHDGQQYNQDVPIRSG